MRYFTEGTDIQLVHTGSVCRLLGVPCESGNMKGTERERATFIYM